MEPQNNIIEPTNKNHRILILTISILLTAAVIGGGMYYFLNQQIKKQNELITELEKSNKKIEDKTNPKTQNGISKEEQDKIDNKDETADWKSYKSNFGFSLKHPVDWSAKKWGAGSDKIEAGSDWADIITFNNDNSKTASTFLNEETIRGNIKSFKCAEEGKINKIVKDNLATCHTVNTGTGSEQYITYIVVDNKLIQEYTFLKSSSEEFINILVRIINTVE